MLVDSHCHLDRIDLTPFEHDLGKVVAAARANGVGQFLCVAIDLERWPAMRGLVDPFPEIAVSVGVHPSEAPRGAPALAAVLHHSADPRVVAIGETGLDYYYGADQREAQLTSFRTHVRAARDCGKPLIVHSRDAREDTLAVLREEGASEVGGVLHCFTEDWDMAERAMDLGFYISFSGIVTFRNAADLREVVARVPADRLLVETDSPYLAPVPHRGRSNHPAWVLHVAECVAGVRGETVEQVAEYTTTNYFRLFGHGDLAAA